MSEFDQIMEIEEQSFELPKTRKQLLELMRDSITVTRHIDGDVVGFIIYGYQEGAFEIRDIGVHLKHRRMGHGTKLIKECLKTLHPLNVLSANVEVDETNLGCQLFFKEVGFVATSIKNGFIRMGYYL